MEFSEGILIPRVLTPAAATKEGCRRTTVKACFGDAGLFLACLISYLRSTISTPFPINDSPTHLCLLHCYSLNMKSPRGFMDWTRGVQLVGPFGEVWETLVDGALLEEVGCILSGWSSVQRLAFHFLWSSFSTSWLPWCELFGAITRFPLWQTAPSKTMSWTHHPFP